MTTTRDRQRRNRIAIALLPALIATAMYLATGTSAHATDCTWTNNIATGPNYNFTDAGNWSPAVPLAGDNAIFTNDVYQQIDPVTTTVITNANVYFNRNSSGNALRLWIRDAKYWVTNDFIIGQNAGSSNYVWSRDALAQASIIGILAVTNAQRTARMIVGQAGQGRFDLTVNVVVDHLYVTNNGSIVNQFLLGNNGHLTIQGDSTISTLTMSGYGGNYTSRWNVIGGTTTVQTDQPVGQVCMVVVTASGTNTVMNFQGAVRMGQYPQATATNGNSIIVTNGAVVNVSGDTYVGYARSADTTVPHNNLLVITGSNSLFNAADLYVGNDSLCTNNRVRVENGGRLNTTSTWCAIGRSGHYATFTVTGAGSIVSNGGSQAILVSQGGDNNQIIISDGGQLIAPSKSGYSLYIGDPNYAAADSNNTVLVTGTNSLLQAGGNVEMGRTPNNQLIVTNAGQVIIGGVFVLGRFGTKGCSNQVAIGGGGYCSVSSDIYIGFDGNASNHTVLVTGAGSVLTNTGSMYIGSSYISSGGGNQLVLGSGGRVYTPSLTLQDNTLTNMLKFVATPGITNLGVVNVGSALTIANANTAKLVVDMSQYTEWRAGVTSVVLATYGTMSTKFSPGNITVTPPPMLPMRITATVDQTTGNRIQVNLKVPKGTVVSGR